MLRRIFSLAVAFTLLISLNCFGSAIPYKSFYDLVIGSDGILVGKVIELESVLYADNDIKTYVTLSNLKVIDGIYKENKIIFQLEGGEVDGDGIYIPGTPIFSLGEQVLVFVTGNGENIIPFVGWVQGVFRITEDENKKVKVLSDHYGNNVTAIKDGTIIKKLITRNISSHLPWSGFKIENSVENSSSAKGFVGDGDGHNLMIEGTGISISPESQIESPILTVDDFVDKIMETKQKFKKVDKSMKSYPKDRYKLPPILSNKATLD